jgi:hypothetical protein
LTLTSDDIGDWDYLGLLSPQDRIWLQFPNQSNSSEGLFRITCYCDSFNKINSYGIIRPKYQLANSVHFGLGLKFYPRPDKQLLEIPIPKALILRDIYNPYFEIMKIVRYRRGVGLTPSILWDIKLEELKS